MSNRDSDNNPIINIGNFFGTDEVSKPSKKMEAFLAANKKVENSSLGAKIQTIGDSIREKLGDPHRQKFVSGILSWDLQMAVRDKDGNVIQIGDSPGLHMLYSKTSQGKSISMFTKAANFVRNGLTGLIVNSEQEAAEEFMTLCQMAGLDMDRIHVTYCSELESILTTVEKGIGNYKSAGKQPIYDFIIIDSLDTQYSKAEGTKGSAKDDMALTARRMSRFLRINHEHLFAHDVRLYIICQFRNSLDAMSEYSIDNYSGGNAAKHYARSISYVRRSSIAKTRAEGGRFKVSNKEKGDGGVSSKGFPISIKLMKSKISGAIEGSVCTYDFYHMQGIDKIGSMFEFAYDHNLIEQVDKLSYMIGAQKIKGIENAKDAFRSDIDFQKEIAAKLVETARFHSIDMSQFVMTVEDETEMDKENAS